MREITKTISLPLDGKETTFRLSKLDAFSGARLLKLLSSLPNAEGQRELPLAELLLLLPEEKLEALMRVCLTHAEISLPAGYVPVFREDCWGLPDLQYETALCLRLTGEVADWTLRGFFVEGGQPS